MNDTATAASLSQLADEIARSLAHARMLDGRAYIRTPVLFPSGATAVVVIEEEGGDGYRLSDPGQGLDEASQLSIAPPIGARRRRSRTSRVSSWKAALSSCRRPRRTNCWPGR